MQILKRCVLLGLILLVMIPVSFAEITITMQDKKIYSLGEKIKPDISVKENQDYNGFFKLTLMCGDYSLQYYTLPLSTEAGIRTVVDVVPLTLLDSMTGECKIKAAFDKSDGAHIDSTSSPGFEVMDMINIALETELEAKPGEDITITANLNKGSNVAFNGNVEVHYNNKKADVEVVEGKLVHKISIEPDAEASQRALTIKASDNFGNYGEETFSLKVLQIPTRLENQIENDILNPGEDLKATILLYDHKSNLIENAKVSLEVFDSKENRLTETEVESNDIFTMYTDNSFEPGAYYVLTRYDGLKKQSSFTITEMKKISMKQENNAVYVENTGNIQYNNEVTIILENDDKDYLINKKLKLEPGEKITIDLSKEVPSGTYDVILPEDAVEEEGETAEIEVAEQNIIESVLIEDNRNIIKKAGSGISKVTGAAINTAKIVASKPTLASVILITIILGVLTYYSRGYIVGKIRRKKGDDTSGLFSDFEFEDEDSKR